MRRILFAYKLTFSIYFLRYFLSYFRVPRSTSTHVTYVRYSATHRRERILFIIYYCLVRTFRFYISFTHFASYTSTFPFIHFILYRTRLIIPSAKLWQLSGFCLLAVLPYRRSSPSCIAPLFSIIVFSSVSPSVFGPPAISHSSITCLESSSFSLFFPVFPRFGLLSTSESR